VKYCINNTAPVSVLLWGSESWKLSKANYNKQRVFHNAATRYSLDIKWEQEVLREQKIRNEEEKQCLEALPMIDFFINRRT